MSYIDEVNQKRRTQQDDKLMRAALMNSQQKPSIILTDSTDLGEHIAELGDKIIEVMREVRADKSTKEQIDRLSTDFKRLQVLASQLSNENTDKMCRAIDELKTTIAKQKPVVVPAPSVSLQEKDVDFSDVIKAINKLAPKTAKKGKMDLSGYRAHDLDDARDGMQYIGFIDSEGSWYIMQHDPSANRDRYYFGTQDYETAWDEKHVHEYKILSEAIRALSA